jgi:hypothetical protein
MISILSYCDTEDKKERLSFLIRELKRKYADKKILVYSHYRDLESKYYSLADYYIFDHSNPVSRKKYADWIWVTHQGKKFYRLGEDWGFAVLQMIKRSSLFIKSISSEGCLFLNYDSDPSEIESFKFIEMGEELDNSHIGIFCPWGSGISAFSLTCFYLDLPKIPVVFFEKISMQEYMSFPPSLVPEEIFKSMVEKEFIGKYLISDQGLTPQVSGADREIPSSCQLFKFFGTLLPTRNNFTEDKRKCLAAWNCTEKIDQIGIEIEGVPYFIYNEIEGENSTISFFSHLPDVHRIEKIKVTSVNNEEINPPYLIDDLDQSYWDRNYHETV